MGSVQSLCDRVLSLSLALSLSRSLALSLSRSLSFSRSLVLSSRSLSLFYSFYHNPPFDITRLVSYLKTHSIFPAILSASCHLFIAVFFSSPHLATILREIVSRLFFPVGMGGRSVALSLLPARSAFSIFFFKTSLEISWQRSRPFTTEKYFIRNDFSFYDKLF